MPVKGQRKRQRPHSLRGSSSSNQQQQREEGEHDYDARTPRTPGGTFTGSSGRNRNDRSRGGSRGGARRGELHSSQSYGRPGTGQSEYSDYGSRPGTGGSDYYFGTLSLSFISFRSFLFFSFSFSFFLSFWFKYFGPVFRNGWIVGCIVGWFFLVALIDLLAHLLTDLLAVCLR